MHQVPERRARRGERDRIERADRPHSVGAADVLQQPCASLGSAQLLDRRGRTRSTLDQHDRPDRRCTAEPRPRAEAAPSRSAGPAAWAPRTPCAIRAAGSCGPRPGSRAPPVEHSERRVPCRAGSGSTNTTPSGRASGATRSSSSTQAAARCTASESVRSATSVSTAASDPISSTTSAPRPTSPRSRSTIDTPSSSSSSVRVTSGRLVPDLERRIGKVGERVERLGRHRAAQVHPGVREGGARRRAARVRPARRHPGRRPTRPRRPSRHRAPWPGRRRTHPLCDPRRQGWLSGPPQRQNGGNPSSPRTGGPGAGPSLLPGTRFRRLDGRWGPRTRGGRCCDRMNSSTCALPDVVHDFRPTSPPHVTAY